MVITKVLAHFCPPLPHKFLSPYIILSPLVISFSLSLSQLVSRSIFFFPTLSLVTGLKHDSGLLLKHPYKRFCFFVFFIFITRDLSCTMVRRVWRFLLPADHGIGSLICPCLVAWSPWFIFLLYTYDYLYFILFSFQISVVI